MKSEAKQMEKTMGKGRLNKNSMRSESDNAKTLLAAMMTEQKGGRTQHDGGENEGDSADEELEDMEALNRSLSLDAQDVQYHGGHHDKDGGGQEEEMGMLQKSVFNLLSVESERLIKELYLKYRHKLRNDFKNRITTNFNYEKKKKFVEEKIEKDILYFENSRMSEL